MPDFLTATSHYHFDSTDSTNTQLICAIAEGRLPHTASHLYTASHQTKGRGQHGRTWVSGADNVLLSLYAPMGQSEDCLHALSGLLALIVGFHLSQLEPIKAINTTRTAQNLTPIGVKWANDLGFYDNQSNCFKKLAGILIEPVFKKLAHKNTLTGIVIGVGLNVGNAPLIKDGLYHATCLNELSDNQFYVQALYQPITHALLTAIQTCNDCQDGAYLNNFIQAFNQQHTLTHHHVAIFMQNNMNDVVAQGQCMGIGNQGELLLNNQGIITPIFAGMAKIIKE